MTVATIELAPQPGPQTAFLSSPADIVFYGGAAGGGKSFGLLLEATRHMFTVPGYGAVIFRRTSPQIRNEGGLWDESINMFTGRGSPREHTLDWTFPPYNNSLTFAHMQYEGNRTDWQGAQIAYMGWDELPHFTRKQFFYMLSRSRSTSGVKPYIRATYNPVPPDDETGGWTHEFVGWYLDPDGYPDLSKSGVVRWFANVNDELIWDNDKEALTGRLSDMGHDGIEPKSFTVIFASVYDNKILLDKDPGYLANLHALDHIDQERLLHANHFIKPAAGKVYNKAWFEVVDALPAGNGVTVRFWDLAATVKKQKKNDPDFTASCKMLQLGNVYYILDITAEQISPADTNLHINNLASQDGKHVEVVWEEEGGASGKRDSYHLATMLDGYGASGERPRGDKLARGKGFGAQAKIGNVKLLRGAWNDRFLNHMHAIPDGAHDDIHDATVGAYNKLAERRPAFL